MARSLDKPPQLEEYIPGTIWLCRYPVSCVGTEFDARMTVIRLRDGKLMLHSPCAIDSQMKTALTALGPTAYLVAPGTYHYLHMASAQAAFPAAETFICPGVERKCPELAFDRLLGDTAPDGWRGQLDQVPVAWQPLDPGDCVLSPGHQYADPCRSGRELY